MDFQELGQTLKQEREKKGLSIEVVMEATKISRTNIVAMESGDRDSLPHPVYTKGFVKSYARYLGLDPVELSMAVDQEYQDELDGPEERIYEVSPAAEKAFQETDAPELKRKPQWPLMLVLVFLAVIVVLLIMNLNGNKGADDKKEAQVSTETVEKAPSPIAESEESATPEMKDAIAGEADAPEQADEATDEAISQEEAAAADENAAAPEVKVEPKTKPESKPESKPEPVVEATPVVQVAANTPEGQEYDHVVVVRATTEKGCWIGVWKGDETKMYRDYVLKNGEPLRLMFNTLRRVRIGNVAGVTVTYNGKAYSLDKAAGNIQTLRFGE